MTINVRVTRGSVLRVKVSPDVSARLEAFAVRFGLPTSTLAAYAVAQWVLQQEQSANVAKALANSVGVEAGQAIQQMFKLLESAEDKPDA